MVNFHTSSCIDQSGDGDSQGFTPVGAPFRSIHRLRENYFGTEELEDLHALDKKRIPPQGTQKILPTGPPLLMSAEVEVEVKMKIYLRLPSLSLALTFRNAGGIFQPLAIPARGSASMEGFLRPCQQTV